MSKFAKNKERKTGKNWLWFILISFLFIFHVQAEEGKKFLLGAYSGWAFGLGDEFKESGSPSNSEYYKLNLHLGGFVQYDFSESLGVQINFNYQNVSHTWIHHSQHHPDESSTSSRGFFSSNLNGVFNLPRRRNTQVYFLAGGGICGGNWDVFSGLYFNVAGGAGVKIYLRSDSRSAFILGGTIHHLLDRNEYGSHHATYVRFHAGFEFCPNDRETIGVRSQN
jgi:hypothetical protein